MEDSGCIKYLEMESLAQNNVAVSKLRTRKEKEIRHNIF